VLPIARGDAPEGLVNVASGSADVVAGRKMIAGAAEHDHDHFVVVGSPTESLIERVGELRVLGISVAWTVHGDDRDRALLSVEHELCLFVVHLVTSGTHAPRRASV